MIARFLLEGKILVGFKAILSYYNADPQIIKPSNVNEKVQRLVNIIKKYKM